MSDDARAATAGATGTPELAPELAALTGRLDGLADRPVGEHPDELEAVHRALVDELDALAGDARARS